MRSGPKQTAGPLPPPDTTTKSSSTDKEAFPSTRSSDTEPNTEPPQGLDVTGPRPVSTIVPKGAESSQSLQGWLWNQAYDGVKAADPGLTEVYEKVLSTELQRQRTGTAYDAFAASNKLGRLASQGLYRCSSSSR